MVGIDLSDHRTGDKQAFLGTLHFRVADLYFRATLL